MKNNVSKRKSYPWCHPRMQTDMEYGDIDEFLDIQSYFSRHPNEEFSVRLYRQKSNGDYCHLRDGHWEDHDLEDIKHLYGGGTYKFKFMDGKKRFLRTIIVGIDSSFRGRLPVPNF